MGWMKSPGGKNTITLDQAFGDFQGDYKQIYANGNVFYLNGNRNETKFIAWTTGSKSDGHLTIQDALWKHKVGIDYQRKYVYRSVGPVTPWEIATATWTSVQEVYSGGYIEHTARDANKK